MIIDKFRIDGQVAIVTGGTKGLGRTISSAFAEAGADITTVSGSSNPDLEKAILALGRRYMHYSADLTRRDQTRKVVPAILEKMGSVDILVNNAGIIRRTLAVNYTETDWDVTMEIDLTATFILCQAVGRIMLEKGRGKIINIASVLSFQGGINVVAYSASKHGVAGLTKALANEWASKGINVNAIALSFFPPNLQKLSRKIRSVLNLLQRELLQVGGGIQRILQGLLSFWPHQPLIMCMEWYFPLTVAGWLGEIWYSVGAD